MTRNIQMKGTADLLKFLDALPANMERNAINAGLRRGAGIIRDEARLRAPKQTGQMAKAIKTGSPRKNQDGTFSIRVYVDEKANPHGFLGYLVEYNIKPHLIARKVAKRGRKGLAAAVNSGEKITGVLKIGDRYVSGVVKHPGVLARPFLRPALDTKAEEAVAAFADAIRGYIEGKTGLALSPDVDEAA